MKTNLPPNPRILLLHRHGGLGDVLVSTCVSRAILHHWPDAHISYLASKAAATLLQDCPSVHQVIVTQDDSPGTFALAKIIREGRYDSAISLWSTGTDAWATFLAGVPIRVGPTNRLLYSQLFTDRVAVRSERGDTDSHWADILLDYVRELGVHPDPARMDYRLHADAIRDADMLLRESNLAEGEPLIGFHIGKGLSLRECRWPADAFLNMAKAVIETIPCRLLLTGSTAESALVGDIAAKLDGRAIDVSGRTDARCLAGLISRCASFICPDSFPMHLAAALDVPVVGIFALRSDFVSRWRPLSDTYRIVRPAEWSCEGPCVKESCLGFDCYKHIDSMEIVRALKEILPSTSEPSGGVCAKA